MERTISIGQDIQIAQQLLEKGEVVAIPTETVYGLGANALEEKAAIKIFEVKQRPTFDPLIIHLGRLEQVGDYVKYIPERLQELAIRFCPGPLTLLLPKKAIISDLITAGSDFVAVRIPAHPITNELLNNLDFPVAAPSANPFGYISPTTAQHVAQQLGDKISYILDGGACKVGIESTIVGIEEGQVTIFRKGGLSIEAIETVVGSVKVKTHSTSNPKAPGMLKSHYAPKIPFLLGDIDALLAEQSNEKKIGVISFLPKILKKAVSYHEVLSATGNFSEAAQKLFASMRALDNMDLDVIIAELLPERDLGIAINDRLRRAAV